MAKGVSHKRNEKAISILAANIKKYRLANNLTIQQLSNLLEVDYSQIGRIERCVVNPSVSIIFDIANVLKIEPYKLLEWI